MKDMIYSSFPYILEFDVSGVVTEVEPKVSKFKKGHEVYSRPNTIEVGALAEYTVVQEEDVAFKPVKLSHQEAASNSIDVSTVGVDDVSAVLTGISNYPNPFNPNTTISFSLKSNAKVELAVYNTKGQLVKTLVNSKLSAGNHSYNWNGVDDQNKPVGSGLYLYKVKTADSETIRKMLLVK